MDALSHYLNALNLASTSISKWHVTAPWGVRINDFAPGFLLTVFEGPPVVVKTDHTQFTLQAGDTLLAPRGGRCVIGSDDAQEYVPISSLPWQGVTTEPYHIEQHHPTALRVSFGGAGEHTVMLGIAFVFNDELGGLIINALPDFIPMRSEGRKLLSLMRPAVEFLVADVDPGYFAVARQLAEFAVIALLRDYIITREVFPVGPLRGILDHRLSRALLAMHEMPERKWTLAALAKVSSMSRASFAQKFKGDVGQTPMAYLLAIRLAAAAQLLLHTSTRITDLASKVGFQSDRVFRHAFKKAYGVPPKVYRQQHKKPTPQFE